MKRILFIYSCLVIYCVDAQNQTVGLFQYNAASFDGYTLFSPNESTYLIDNCGKQINTWQSSYKPGNSVYLLEDGTLLRACRIQSMIFSGGGSGGRVEQRDWDNNLLWYYDFSDNNYHQHHDIQPMPNGNILVLCWEYKSDTDAIASGRNPNGLQDNQLWPTYILEVAPVGNNSINIVWEWHVWDHLVQDIDTTKSNYGIVANYPELLNINSYNGNGAKDWLHCNSIDYNPQLDQIIISSRKLSEFYIIDHSTTSAEAATHSGGIYGKGGDILYRWGNPQRYDNGTPNNQQLFGQHDVHWIPSNYPDGGKIILFNNGESRGYSTMDIVSPPTNSNGHYFINTNNTFGPDSAEWVYTDPIPTDFYASYISGVQRLANGNTLICDGPHGIFFELDENKDKVWEYINPVVNVGPLAQGDIIPITQNGWGNSTFRCRRYATDYPGLYGQNLTPTIPLELNPLPDSCSMATIIEEVGIIEKKKLLRIVDILGREVLPQTNKVLFYIYRDGSVRKHFILR